MASPYRLLQIALAAVLAAADRLRFAAGNFYVNDKPTGAVVGQQPFGGSRALDTNDKAGSALNLLRWTSARSIKETFVPPTDHNYRNEADDGRLVRQGRPARDHGGQPCHTAAVTAERMPVTRKRGSSLRPGRYHDDAPVKDVVMLRNSSRLSDRLSGRGCHRRRRPPSLPVGLLDKLGQRPVLVPKESARHAGGFAETVALG